MVSQTIKRLMLRWFPELGTRKHLPQLARITKIYDMPTNGAKVSSQFRPYVAADVQLIDAVTGNDLTVPAFEQVSIAVGQPHERGVYSMPEPGMQCLIQYIDGLDSMPVITSLLPWGQSIPDHQSDHVVLQQSNRSQIAGKDGNWHLKTDGAITSHCQSSSITAQQRTEQFTNRQTLIAAHDEQKVDGNQINEIMGSLKTVVGEKALIAAFDQLLLGSQQSIEIQAAESISNRARELNATIEELAKVQAGKCYFGNESTNLFQKLSELAGLVADLAAKVATHKHPGVGPAPTAAEFTAIKNDVDGVKNDVDEAI